VNGSKVTLWSTHAISKPDHEHEFTDVVVAFYLAGLHEIKRQNVDYHADGEIVIDDEKHYIEYDRGKMTPGEIRERMKKYESCEYDVLWICPTQERVAQLKKIAMEFSTEFWFITKAELIANPRRCFIEDKNGVVTTLIAIQDATQDA